MGGWRFRNKSRIQNPVHPVKKRSGVPSARVRSLPVCQRLAKGDESVEWISPSKQLASGTGFWYAIPRTAIGESSREGVVHKVISA